MDIARVRDPAQKMEMVKVFGEERPFLTGPLRIAIRCRTPVLQTFIISEEGFRYRLKITGTLIDVDNVNDEAAVVTDAIRTYASNLERSFRERPSLLTRL